MCGIFGLISNDGFKLSNDRLNLFKQGLVSDTLRGVHSTGAFTVKENGHVNSCKRAIPGWDFVDLKAFEAICYTSHDINLYVGHNRFATKGKINNTNSHPFMHGNIIGVHNGSLLNHHDLVDGHKFDVDSEAIINSIDKVGVKETIINLDGAFALVWYNLYDKTLNLIRNEERPLSIIKLSHSDTLIFASELEMAEWLAVRNGFSIEDRQIITPGLHYVIPLSNIHSMKVEEIPLRKKIVTTYSMLSTTTTKEDRHSVALNTYGIKLQDKIHLWVNQFQPYNYKNSDGTRGIVRGFAECPNSKDFLDIVMYNMTKADYDRLSSEEMIGTVIVTSKLDNNNIALVIDAKSLECERGVRGPNNRLVSPGTFKILTKDGCSMCSGDLTEKDAAHITWTHNNDPLCPSCQMYGDN